jgi:hypothetical protein
MSPYVYFRLTSRKLNWLCWAAVVRACNPSYSGGRDPEDYSLKPAQANNLWNPTQKTLCKNGADGVAQGEGPEFKPQYWEKKIFNWLKNQR